MIMLKSTSILLLFTSSIFLTTAVYAEEQNFETLRAQVAEAHTQIKVLQKENKDLGERLAIREMEIAAYEEKLKKIESDINILKESG